MEAGDVCNDDPVATEIPCAARLGADASGLAFDAATAVGGRGVAAPGPLHPERRVTAARDVLGAALVLLGLLMDAINVWWGYRTARGPDRRSGLALVPALLYVAGVLVADLGVSPGAKIGAAAGAVILHVACYQLIPAVFYRVFAPREKDDGAR